MKTIKIEGFRSKNQLRITFVNLLRKYNPNLRLKLAKSLLDGMLEGKPIIYQVTNPEFLEFIKELDALDVLYLVQHSDTDQGLKSI